MDYRYGHELSPTPAQVRHPLEVCRSDLTHGCVSFFEALIAKKRYLLKEGHLTIELTYQPQGYR